jgi:UDP-glucose 4-epimerase
MQEKVIVTGGAGFIGSHLVEALVERGFEVHVVDTLIKGGRDRIPADATLHVVDVRDTDALVPIFSGAVGVFHLAALPSVQYSVEHPVESHSTNVEGTLSVLEAARAAAVGRVVFASSSAVYGNHQTMPLCEDFPTVPVHPYGLHKLIGEQYMQLYASLYGLPTVSLRFFNVYGPRLDPSGPYALVVGRFITQRLAGEPLTIVGDGTQTRDFVHVSDIVRALQWALTSTAVGAGEAINVGTGEALSVNDIASLYGECERTHLPPRAEPKHSRADITLARKLLGWEPAVTSRDGLSLFILEHGIGER